jgi:hypothetical protein
MPYRHPCNGLCRAPSKEPIGKVDAMFFILGGLLGVWLFAESYPAVQAFYELTKLGDIKVFDSLHMSQGLFVFLLVVIAVGAFAATTKIERKVAGEEAPSHAFPVLAHMGAGAFALFLGFVIMVLPDYKTHMVRKVTSPSYQAKHPVQVIEEDDLAFRIVDQEPLTKIIDLRAPSAYAGLALPGSVNLDQNGLFARDLGTTFNERRFKKVIVGDDEAQERTACLLLQEMGYENLAILRGGFPTFDKIYLHPSPYTPAGDRWDADVKRFRGIAQVQIPKLIAANKAAATREPKKEKKIQGGC